MYVVNNILLIRYLVGIIYLLLLYNYIARAMVLSSNFRFCFFEYVCITAGILSIQLGGERGGDCEWGGDGEEGEDGGTGEGGEGLGSEESGSGFRVVKKGDLVDGTTLGVDSVSEFSVWLYRKQ